MPYSYQGPENGLEVTNPLPQGDAGAMDTQAFQLEQALKALEESLPLGLNEGMGVYREYQGLQRPKSRAEQGSAGELRAISAQESGWDALARHVAGHVVEYMGETLALAEVENWRNRADTLYADNRAMAQHIQRLVQENEQLRASVGACELELAHYRHLVGNLYLKL